MNFRPELADKALAGTKTETRRELSDNPRSPWWRDRCAYVPGGGPGGSYALCPGRGEPAIGRLVVEDVSKVRLGHITHPGARAEGFADVRDFVDAWVQINGAWRPADYVWRVRFHAEPLPARVSR